MSDSLYEKTLAAVRTFDREFQATFLFLYIG